MKKLAIEVFKLAFRKRNTRSVYTVSTSAELTRYYDSLKLLAPRSYPFQNIALCKQRGIGKDQPTILTDEWPNFSCTAVFQPWTSTHCFPTRYQRTSRLMLLSSCRERFTAFLHESKLLKEGAMITAIDCITNKHLDHAAKSMFSSWEETRCYAYNLYYVLNNAEEYASSTLDPEKYFIDKLTVDHVDYITNYWTDKNKPIPIIQRYLRSTLTMYNFSIGIFLRSHPSNPVSWMTYSDYGHATFLHTIPEYRGNGLFGITIATLFSNLLDNDIVPLGERTKGSYMSKKFSHIEKCIPSYTWRDSITGKCYW